MALPDAALNNFRWKLTALLLAMVVWFVIKFAIYRGITGGRKQVLRHQPVMVLSAPEDTGIFHLDPPQVDVVLQSTKELTGDDIEVFLNLTTMPDVNSALKPVLVRAADSTKLVLVRVDPPFVTAERVSPPEPALTNSFRRP
jgi:hypothetical protein